MSLRPRPWLPRFSDPAALSDLYAAARDCMAVCSCEPEDCDHAVNQMTPLEFVEWLEAEGRRAARGGHQTAMGRELARASARRRADRPPLLATG